MPDNQLQKYFQSQQISRQWLPFLRSLAHELPALADIEFFSSYSLILAHASQREEYREPFCERKTLEQLETRLNEYWARINWGWAEFHESQGFIEITHRASPLAEASGNDALAWIVSLLEGIYQTVFSVLGASEKMVVRRLEEPTGGMDVKLRFGRP